MNAVYLITCAIQCVGTDPKTGHTKFRHISNDKSKYKQFLRPKNNGTLTSNPIPKQRFMPIFSQADLNGVCDFSFKIVKIGPTI